MKYLPSLLLTLIALLYPSSLDASPWPIQGHDPQNTNFSSHEQSITHRNIARLHAVRTITGASQAVAARGRLYVAFTAGRGVGVFNARTGGQIQRFTNQQLGLAQVDSVNALAYGGGLLVVGTFLQTLALDAAHGRVLWRRWGGATDVIVSGATVYTGEGCQTGCGAVGSEAVDLRSGRILWRHPGNFGGRPVLIRGFLYQTWGESAGNTRVYDPVTGKRVRSLPLSGLWVGDRHNAYVVHGNGFAFGPHRALVLARIRADGALAWQVALGKTGYTNPALAYGQLYVTSNRFHPGILAVSTANGHVAWGTVIPGIPQSDAPRIASVIVANHMVFVAAASHLDILDAGSGALLRALPPLTADIQRLVLSNGTVYAVSGAGVTLVRP